MHFGVKGMRWGVRKEEPEAVSSKPVRKAADSLDVKAVNKSAAKVEAHGTRVLSNQELQGLVNRMNLEQQYSRLSETPETKQGDNVVKQILGHVNTAQTVYKHINSPLGKKVGTAIKTAQKAAKSRTGKVVVGTGLALL